MLLRMLLYDAGTKLWTENFDDIGLHVVSMINWLLFASSKFRRCSDIAALLTYLLTNLVVSSEFRVFPRRRRLVPWVSLSKADVEW